MLSLSLFFVPPDSLPDLLNLGKSKLAEYTSLLSAYKAVKARMLNGSSVPADDIVALTNILNQVHAAWNSSTTVQQLATKGLYAAIVNQINADIATLQAQQQAEAKVESDVDGQYPSFSRWEVSECEMVGLMIH